MIPPNIHGLSEEEVDDLAARQQARFPLIDARVEAKMAALPPQTSDINALVRDAESANRPLKRLRRLLAAAEAWAAPAAAQSACRRGCHHCCYLAVQITTAEAKLLSQATGRPMSVPSHPLRTNDLTDLTLLEIQMAKQTPADGSSPCPFLVDGECSAYDARPMACRTHYNMDDDDLLCRLVPGKPVDVPYLNAMPFHIANLAMQPDAMLADIREFFPAQTASQT